MPLARDRARSRRSTLAIALLIAAGPAASGDVVVLKNGTTYRGMVDRDPPLVQVFDGLRRVVLRDAKVLKVDQGDAPEKLEQFLPQQPMQVGGGQMPEAAIITSTGPWDEAGRRTFSYQSPRMKRPLTMTQGINALNPQVVRYRGIDGYWMGQIATSQVPKPVVMGILGKLDQKNEDHRLRIVRFQLQAGWYADAKEELARLSKDFPGLKDKVAGVRSAIADLEGRNLLQEIEIRRKALQPREVANRLKTFPTANAPPPFLIQVRDALRRDDVQAASDVGLADSIRKVADAQPPDVRNAWRGRLVEVLKGLAEAPESVRDRLDAFSKAESEGKVPADAQFALAMSAWVVGSDAATGSIPAAETLWKARDLIRGYLADSQADPAPILTSLTEIDLADPASPTRRKLDLELVARIARLMPPPLDDPTIVPGKPRLLRIRDDPNPQQPTEYSVLLPPEYNPLRSYPMVVALHSSKADSIADRTLSAINRWSAEATRRGYIVIAPEYSLRDQPVDYRYSSSESAAVELALRDARRRFAVDSDRVYLVGAMIGANMAWDFGLAHPDEFAGVAVVSGLPAKFVWGNKDNTRRLPFYIAVGDLAPTEPQIILKLGKDLITEGYDVTYVEFYARGLEDLPEETPHIFDWMEKRRRETFPKSFEIKTARASDDRFYGVVVREFNPGRSIAPEAADPLGRNLKPAVVRGNVNPVLNLFDIKTEGVRSVDVWVPLGPIDFTKKVEVRVNNRSILKALPTVDFEPLLEDLRVRGDRKQLYALKVSAGVNPRR